MTQATQTNKELISLLQAELELERNLQKAEARIRFSNFISYTDPEYQWNWHHHLICDRIDKIVSGEIKRLIITMPPRHGKSELATKKSPAYILGVLPDVQMIVTSYSDGLVRKMNRGTQKIMKSQAYAELFPRSYLNQINVFTGKNARQNAQEFDMPCSKGSYRCASVMSGITGQGADFLIIDDPIKNREEAESITYRERLHDEYKNTLRTRLMPGGRIILILTRWHEDDLAGRLIRDANDPTVDYPEEWHVLSLEAIKETDHAYDPRRLGEALWPDWYPVKALLQTKSAMGHDFTALYQQAPTSKKGNIILREWFNWYDPAQMDLPMTDFFVDSADEDKAHNDRTAVLGFAQVENDLYLVHGAAIRAKFPRRVEWLQEIVNDRGHYAGSRVWIEPKSSGIAMFQYLQASSNLNVIKDKPPLGSKFTRLKAVSPRVESGRVYLPLNQGWVTEFLEELCGFPGKPFDDYVDCFVGAIKKTLGGVSLDMSASNYDDY